MTDRPILFSAQMIQALLAGRKRQTRRVLKDAPTDSGWIIQPTMDGKQAWFGPFGYPSMPCVLRFAKGDRLWVRETWAQHHPAGVQAGRFSMAGRAGIPGPPGVTYRVIYRADGDPLRVWHCNDYPYRSPAGPRDEIDGRHPDVCSEFPGWDSPMCMPRWASRLTLTVTDVRVQRLQEIGAEDAIAEGVFFTDYGRKCGHTARGWTDVGDCPAPPETHPQRPGWMWKPTTGADQCPDTARFAYANLWQSINGPGSWDANPWVVALTFAVEQRNIDA